MVAVPEEGAPPAAGFSLSFAGAKRRAVPRLNVQGRAEEVQREAVVGFAQGKLELVEKAAPAPSGKRVIPRLENTFSSASAVEQARRKRARFVPDSLEQAAGNEERFEQAAPEAKEEVTYGLSAAGPRAPPQTDAAVKAEIERSQEERSLLDKLRLQQDLEELPDEASEDAYRLMPVEEFGKAIMRGLGWSEGKAVGRDAERRNLKEVVAREYASRAPLLGLGATPAPGPPPRGAGKPPTGKAPQAKPPPASQEAPGVREGATMRVLQGEHRGLLCEVVRLLPEEGGRSRKALVRTSEGDAVALRLSELGRPDESLPAQQGSAGSAGGPPKGSVVVVEAANGGEASGERERSGEKKAKKEKLKSREKEEKRRRREGSPPGDGDAGQAKEKKHKKGKEKDKGKSKGKERDREKGKARRRESASSESP